MVRLFIKGLNYGIKISMARESEIGTVDTQFRPHILLNIMYTFKIVFYIIT